MLPLCDPWDDWPERKEDENIRRTTPLERVDVISGSEEKDGGAVLGTLEESESLLRGRVLAPASHENGRFCAIRGAYRDRSHRRINHTTPTRNIKVQVTVKAIAVGLWSAKSSSLCSWWRSPSPSLLSVELPWPLVPLLLPPRGGSCPGAGGGVPRSVTNKQLFGSHVKFCQI